MKRDLDYMRQLLAELEASEQWQHEIGLSDDEDDLDEKRDYHVILLRDEGLLERIQPGIYRMTAKGHDFLDHTRDDTIWSKSKETVSTLKDHSISMLMSVAEGYVRAKLREITGLDL
ncbi:DUF2513 domain-containing protein [Paracoccus simplex]|uniref:DUF2513 domain-containing protein n=1 Tax=Paracoccus simplex TaxID=2086346 RepID=A0ABV7RU23_9RHOB